MPNRRYRRELNAVLDLVQGRPVPKQAERPTEAPARRDGYHAVLTAALAKHGGASAPWADAWISWVQRSSRLSVEQVSKLAPSAAAVVDRLFLYIEPTEWTGCADLATSLRLGPHGLDRGTPLHALVFEAIRIAKGVEHPENEEVRQELWLSCGVLPDTVSQTTLCWSLPIAASGAWAQSLRARDAAGVPTHLTHLDVAKFPDPLVRPDTVIAVCENARVLEAAVSAGITHPMICVDGWPNTVSTALLRALAVSGASIRYHGDLDREGIQIAKAVFALAGPGASGWRMSGVDYRDAVARFTAEGVPPASFGGRSPRTPWDPMLADAINHLGYAIEEDRQLPLLLRDLTAPSLPA